jgi:hypothetical protein
MATYFRNTSIKQFIDGSAGRIGHVTNIPLVSNELIYQCPIGVLWARVWVLSARFKSTDSDLSITAKISKPDYVGVLNRSVQVLSLSSPGPTIDANLDFHSDMSPEIFSLDSGNIISGTISGIAYSVSSAVIFPGEQLLMSIYDSQTSIRADEWAKFRYKIMEII